MADRKKQKHYGESVIFHFGMTQRLVEFTKRLAETWCLYNRYGMFAGQPAVGLAIRQILDVGMKKVGVLHDFWLESNMATGIVIDYEVPGDYETTAYGKERVRRFPISVHPNMLNELVLEAQKFEVVGRIGSCSNKPSIGLFLQLLFDIGLKELGIGEKFWLETNELEE